MSVSNSLKLKEVKTIDEKRKKSHYFQSLYKTDQN